MTKPILSLHEDEQQPAERMPSLIFGVTSITIGLGTLILLSSYLVDRPLGSPNFYEIELVKVELAGPGGVVVSANPIRRIVPSLTTIWALFFGACTGGLGIFLSRTDSRRHHRARIAATGLILCSMAFVLVLILMARAAS